MINRIKSLLARSLAAPEPVAAFPDRHLALAVLLVEAAYVDGSFDATERKTIGGLARRSFDLNDDEIKSLLGAAEELHRDAADLVRFTRVVKDSFAPEERIEVIEMLWEVVYADGRVDDFEANLMRRLGGLLYVPDRERGAAQKRVAARLASAQIDN
ncbi:MAG: TerB family tellurite resistance protein [Proteobacteria bacterium]|nr:TerB family tellurite resistance protein [Pseudomonadota bacterium]